MNKTKTLAHWKPSKWAPSRLGAKAMSPWSSVTLPMEMLVGAGAGVVGGLIVGKPVGDLLKVSAPLATSILAAFSMAIPLVVKTMPRSSKDVLYGIGAGLAAASVLRLMQPFFAAPVATAS